MVGRRQIGVICLLTWNTIVSIVLYTLVDPCLAVGAKKTWGCGSWVVREGLHFKRWPLSPCLDNRKEPTKWGSVWDVLDRPRQKSKGLETGMSQAVSMSSKSGAWRMMKVLDSGLADRLKPWDLREGVCSACWEWWAAILCRQRVWDVTPASAFTPYRGPNLFIMFSQPTFIRTQRKKRTPSIDLGRDSAATPLWLESVVLLWCLTYKWMFPAVLRPDPSFYLGWGIFLEYFKWG